MKLPPVKVNLISLWKAWRSIRKFLHDQRINAGKKLFSMILLLIIVPVVAIVLTIQGQTYTNSNSSTWDGVNIPRSEPTVFVFKNNSITSRNGNGYMLQAGDESLSWGNTNNLDDEVISGNKLIWNGTDLPSNICHGFFTGFNINVVIKWNYIYRAATSIVVKSDGMTNTSGGISYNIFNNPRIMGISVKGIKGTKIYNNTFYSDQNRYSGSGNAGTGEGIISVFPNDSYSDAYSSNTKIKNNIFYTVHQIANIRIETSEDAEGFESDYNVFWCEEGTPYFDYLGSWKTFSQWQALGYDLHSVVINPEFNNLTDFIPENRLDYGTNLGSNFQNGLSVSAIWNVGSQPATTIQNDIWQVGARIYGGSTGIPKIYEDPKEEKESNRMFGCKRY